MLDFAILQFYYINHSESSKRVALELIKVNKRIDNLAAIAAIDCDEFEPKDFKHCKRNEYTIDSFPKLRLYVPPEKRYDFASKQIKRHFDIPYTEKDMKEATIISFIS